MNLPRRTDGLGEPRELRLVTQAEVVDDRTRWLDDPHGADTIWPEPAPQPAAQPEPRPAWMRWWRVYAIAALPVGGVLAYLVYLNAALFAVVTALTVILVCSGAERVKNRCNRHD